MNSQFILTCAKNLYKSLSNDFQRDYRPCINEIRYYTQREDTVESFVMAVDYLNDLLGAFEFFLENQNITIDVDHIFSFNVMLIFHVHSEQQITDQEAKNIKNKIEQEFYKITQEDIREKYLEKQKNYFKYMLC